MFTDRSELNRRTNRNARWAPGGLLALFFLFGLFPAALAAEPEPIPAGRITQAADRAALTIEDSLAALPGPEILSRSRSRLNEMREDLARLEKDARTQKKIRDSSRALHDLKGTVQIQIEKIEAINKDLTNELTKIDSSRATLLRMQDTWEVTADQLRRERNPQALRERARKLDDRISSALSRIKGKRNDLLSLQARVSDLNAEFRDIERQIADAVQEQRGQLFNRNLPALWSPADISSAMTLAGGAEFLNQMEQFPGDHAPALLLHAVFISLFVLLALFLSRASVLSRFETIFFVPFFSILFGGLLYDPVGGAFREAGWLILTFSGMPLLVRRRPRLLIPGSVLLVVLAAALFRHLTFSAGQFPERLILLGELILIAGLIAYTFYFLIKPDPAEKPWLALLLRSSRLSLAVPLVAIAGEIFGFGLLSRYLGDLAHFALRLGLVVFTVSNIFCEVLPILFGTTSYRRLNFLANRFPDFETNARVVLLWLGLPVWSYIVLGYLDLRTGLLELGRSFFGASVNVGSLDVSIGDVALFLFVVWLTFQLSRLLRAILEEDVYPRSRLPRGVPYAISSLLHYAVLLLGLGAGLSAAGVELSRLAIIGGALGVGIGFGLQNVVNNFVSGIILLFERPVQIGDFIQMEELAGEVKRIGLRSSMIHLVDGSEVIVPNSHLISEKVTNWTLSNSNRRIDIRVGVAYGTDPEVVIAIMKRVGEEHPDILEDPCPTPLFLGFGDSSLDFRLLAWTKKFKERLVVESEMRVNLLTELNAAEITIPFPQRDVHLFSQNVEPEDSQ